MANLSDLLSAGRRIGTKFAEPEEKKKLSEVLLEKRPLETPQVARKEPQTTQPLAEQQQSTEQRSTLSEVLSAGKRLGQYEPEPELRAPTEEEANRLGFQDPFFGDLTNKISESQRRQIASGDKTVSEVIQDIRNNELNNLVLAVDIPTPQKVIAAAKQARGIFRSVAEVIKNPGEFAAEAVEQAKNIGSKIAGLFKRKPELAEVEEVKALASVVAKKDSKELAELSARKTESAVKETGEELLAKEAKKYKSAEEFVKAQGAPVYHGTNKDFEIFNADTFGKASGESGFFGDGFYFTKNKNRANQFADQAVKKSGGKKTVKEFNIELKNPFVIDNNTNINEIVKLSGYKGDIIEGATNADTASVIISGSSKKFTESLKKLGYDGVDIKIGRGADELLVFDKSQIKTKSQLKEAWEQANKKAAGGAEPAATDAIVPMKTAKTPVKPIPTPKPETPIEDATQRIALQDEFSYSDELREGIQDNWLSVKKLMEKPGIKYSDETNPYLKFELFSGRTRAKLDDLEEQFQTLDKQLLDQKIEPTKINDYLTARHAIERNTALGEKAAGITTAEATERFAKLGKELSGEAKIIAEELQDISRRTLDVLEEGQIITPELKKELQAKYPNHIPLQRVMDDTDVKGFLDSYSGKTLSVKGTGLKKAKGSEREVQDVWANIKYNLEQAILRAEKNRVNLSTLNFYRKNKKILGDIFEEVKPKAIGKTFDDKFLLDRPKDVLTIRENGKPVYLKIKNKKLAEALSNVNIESVPKLFRPFATITRYYSNLATRFNVEFGPTNKIRDLQESFINTFKDLGFKHAVKGIAKDATGQNVKAVFDRMRGKTTEGSRLYKQMIQDGGTTGGMAFTGLEKAVNDISDIRSLNRAGITRKSFSKLVKGIDALNTIFEDSTRLGAYRQAIEKGLSREQAASIAKNVTVNFDRKGKASPFLNALYMFSNASIQGTARMLKSFKDPKVLAATAGAVGTLVYKTEQINDAIDPEWRKKTTDWEKNSSIIFVLPPGENGEFRSINIPIAWSLRPMKVLFSEVNSFTKGESNIKDSLGNFLSSALEANNPIGGDDFFSAITPTAFDLPAELFRNKSGLGYMIRPEWKSGLPKEEQYFDDIDETLAGKAALEMGKALNQSPEDIEYIFNQLVGGAGKFVKRLFTTTSELAQGEKPPARDTIFLNRFYKETEAEVAENRIKRAEYTKLEKKMQNTPKDQRKEILFDYVLENGSDAARSAFWKLAEGGVDTAGVPQGISKNLNSAKLYDKFNKLNEQQQEEFLATQSVSQLQALERWKIAEEYGTDISEYILGGIINKPTETGSPRKATKEQLDSHLKKVYALRAQKSFDKVAAGLGEVVKQALAGDEQSIEELKFAREDVKYGYFFNGDGFSTPFKDYLESQGIQ